MIALREHISNEAPALIERRLEHSQNAAIPNLAEPQFLSDLLREVLEQALGTFVLHRLGSEPTAQDNGARRSQTINEVNFEPHALPAANVLRHEGLEDNTNPAAPNEHHLQGDRVVSITEWPSAGEHDVEYAFGSHEPEHNPDVSPVRTRQTHNTPMVDSTNYDTLLDVDAFMGSVDLSGQDFEQFTSMLEQLIDTASYTDSAYQSAPSGTQTPDDKSKDKGKDIESGLRDALA